MSLVSFPGRTYSWYLPSARRHWAGKKSTTEGLRSWARKPGASISRQISSGPAKSWKKTGACESLVTETLPHPPIAGLGEAARAEDLCAEQPQEVHHARWRLKSGPRGGYDRPES